MLELFEPQPITLSEAVTSLVTLGIFAFIGIWFLWIAPALAEQHRIAHQPPPLSEEERERNELACERGRRKEEFVDVFGFDPDLIGQDRYQKEIMLRLALIAKQLKDVGDNAKQHPSIYRRHYANISQEYAEMLELVGLYDPVFQSQIPHWTEFLPFLEQWLKGTKFRRGRTTVTVE